MYLLIHFGNNYFYYSVSNLYSELLSHDDDDDDTKVFSLSDKCDKCPNIEPFVGKQRKLHHTIKQINTQHEETKC